MNDADRLGMLTWSRITRISSSRSKPLRRTPMFTKVPLGPFNRFTVASVVHPLALSPSTSEITSPRRMPLSNAGEPSKIRVAVMSPSMEVIWRPSP